MRMFFNSPDIALQRIEALLKRPLSEEEAAEIAQFERGRLLAPLVNFPGWEIAMATLESFATDTNETLMSMTPGDPAVPTAHAAAHAARQVYDKFRRAINDAVDASHQTPSAMIEAFQNSEVPVESQ